MKQCYRKSVVTYLCSSGERNAEQKSKLQLNYGLNIGAAAVGEKACLGTKQRSTVKNQAHSLSGYRVMLV